MACFGISSITLLRQNFNLTVQMSNIVKTVKVHNTVSCLCYFMSPNSDEQSQSLGFGRPLAEIHQICFLDLDLLLVQISRAALLHSTAL